MQHTEFVLQSRCVWMAEERLICFVSGTLKFHGYRLCSLQHTIPDSDCIYKFGADIMDYVSSRFLPGLFRCIDIYWHKCFLGWDRCS